MLGNFKPQDSVIRTYSGAYQLGPNIQPMHILNKKD